MMPARHRLPAAGLALLATAALAGCGSDSTAMTTTATPNAAPPNGPPPNGPPPSLSDEQRAQFSKLRTCLKKQGVDLPEGGPAAGSAPPQIDQDAIQACARYLPQGIAPPGGSS